MKEQMNKNSVFVVAEIVLQINYYINFQTFAIQNNNTH